MMERPPQVFSEFWMVLAENSSNTTKRHESEGGAKKEAERLAIANPGIRFYVLKSLCAAQVNNPVVWLEADEIPF